MNFSEKKSIIIKRDSSKGCMKMKLIDITHSHLKLVKEQLANTDAFFVKVYSLGQTTVIYEDAATHKDVLIINHKRKIKQTEIDFVVHRLLHTTSENLDIIHANSFVEISIPVENPKSDFS